jgi:hypothetical protein
MHPLFTASDRRAAPIGPTAMGLSAGVRLAAAAGLAAILWLAVAWALGW